MIRRIPKADLTAAPRPLWPPEPSLAATQPEAVATRSSPHVLEAALRALLQEELALKPEHICAVVDRELLRLQRARTVTLHVHPLDARLLAPCASYVEGLSLRGVLCVVEDESVTRGGCILHSNLGDVDASVETRLAAALKLIAEGAFNAP